MGPGGQDPGHLDTRAVTQHSARQLLPCCLLLQPQATPRPRSRPSQQRSGFRPGVCCGLTLLVPVSLPSSAASALILGCPVRPSLWPVFLSDVTADTLPSLVWNALPHSVLEVLAPHGGSCSRHSSLLMNVLWGAEGCLAQGLACVSASWEDRQTVYAVAESINGRKQQTSLAICCSVL